MTDALDRLAAAGGDLLDRVDRLLATTGAPGDHPVWPLVRRLRALPGDAAATVVALRPEPLVVAGADLRELLPAYAEVRAGLTTEVAWDGSAGSAFAARRSALATHLGDAPESLRGRLAATAGYAEALAAWMADTRMALARTLAEVLGSAEAVAVVSEPPSGAAGQSSVSVAAGQSASAPAGPPLALGTGQPAPAVPPAVAPVARVATPQFAAAEIGARVLATVAAAYDEAEALLQRWRPALAEAPYRPPAEEFAVPDGVLRIGR